MSKTSTRRKRAQDRRDRLRGGRLHDLYDRLELASGLPPEEAVRICKEIVNDSIMDDKAAL